MTLADQRIAVTGATGFLGRHVVAALIQRGATVVAMSRSATRAASNFPEGVICRDIDITEPSTLEGAFDGCDVVVHAAAKVGDWGPLEAFNAVSRDGTAHVVAEAERAQVGRLVHVSSVSVYADDLAGPCDEDSLVEMAHGWAYAEGKAGGEERARASKVPWVVIRPGNIFGPGAQHWTDHVAKLTTRRMLWIPSTVGACNMVYVDNVAALIATAAEHPAAVGEVFNAVDPFQETFGTFFEHYAEVLDRRARYLPLPMLKMMAATLEVGAHLTGIAPMLTRAILDYMCRGASHSGAKARSHLGFEPPVSPEDAVARTQAYLRERFGKS